LVFADESRWAGRGSHPGRNRGPPVRSGNRSMTRRRLRSQMMVPYRVPRRRARAAANDRWPVPRCRSPRPLEQGPQTLNQPRRPPREVQQRRFMTFPPSTVALAQEHRGRRTAIRYGLDVHPSSESRNVRDRQQNHPTNMGTWVQLAHRISYLPDLLFTPTQQGKTSA
jgi:hypothetical protein